MPTARPTVVVNDPSMLNAEIDRLATSGGGVVLVKAAAKPYSIALTDGGDSRTDAPVEIRSFDPKSPAVFSSIQATNRENLTIEDVKVVQKAAFDGSFIVQLHNSEAVEIADVVFEGRGNGATGMPGDTTTVRGANLVSLRGSEGVTLRDNVASGFNHGLSLMECDDIQVLGNSFTKFQGDGIRIGGAQDVLIQGNLLHDFFGSTHADNHPDLIQFWGTNIRQNTERVRIVENVLHTGEGPGYQMIFGNNEHRATNGWRFQDVAVEHNVLFGWSPHMISLGDVDGLSIAHNTVLVNPDARTITNNGTLREPFPPKIAVRDSVDVTIKGNIAETYDAGKAGVYNGGATKPVNAIAARDGERPGEDVLDHFVNLEAGGQGDLRDLSLRPDSPLNGLYGSRLTWWSETSKTLLAVAQVDQPTQDRSVVRFDAGLSRDQTGRLDASEATFTWAFEGGTVKEGMVVTHDFGELGRQGYTLTVTRRDGAQDRIERTVDLDELMGGPSPAPSAPAPSTPVVTPSGDGFELSLYNAATDRALFDLAPSTVVEARSVAGLALTVVADAVKGQSASLSLNGARAQVENAEPYALFGDKGGNLAGGLRLARDVDVAVEAALHSLDHAKGTVLARERAVVEVESSTLTGRAGVSDVFVLHEGKMGSNVIKGFEDRDDLLFFGGKVISAAAGAARATTAGGDTTLDFGGGHKVVLDGFVGLDADHFIL